MFFLVMVSRVSNGMLFLRRCAAAFLIQRRAARQRIAEERGRQAFVFEFSPRIALGQQLRTDHDAVAGLDHRGRRRPADGIIFRGWRALAPAQQRVDFPPTFFLDLAQVNQPRAFFLGPWALLCSGLLDDFASRLRRAAGLDGLATADGVAAARGDRFPVVIVGAQLFEEISLGGGPPFLMLFGHDAALRSALGVATGFAAASAMIAETHAFIIRTETALPICLIFSVLVPANS